jgi:hypothetical protein
MQLESTITEQKPAGWRLGLALVFIGLSLSTVLFIPLITASNLSTELKATISGLLVFGIPQVFMLAAVAVVGKAGFNYLKGRIFGFFKQLGPAKTVSRTRYRIGLVMFALPILLGFLGPYIANLIPELGVNRLLISVTGDLMLLASFFVLGGDFWDKLQALFIHQAKAQIPNRD